MWRVAERAFHNCWRNVLILFRLNLLKLTSLGHPQPFRNKTVFYHLCPHWTLLLHFLAAHRVSLTTRVGCLRPWQTVGPELPAVPPSADLSFTWGNLTGPEFTTLPMTRWYIETQLLFCTPWKNWKSLCWWVVQVLSGLWYSISPGICGFEGWYCTSYPATTITDQEVEDQKAHSMPWESTEGLVHW